jgi:hypothetical protein
MFLAIITRSLKDIAIIHASLVVLLITVPFQTGAGFPLDSFALILAQILFHTTLCITAFQTGLYTSVAFTLLYPTDFIYHRSNVNAAQSGPDASMPPNRMASKTLLLFTTSPANEVHILGRALNVFTSGIHLFAKQNLGAFSHAKYTVGLGFSIPFVLLSGWILREMYLALPHLVQEYQEALKGECSL